MKNDRRRYDKAGGDFTRTEVFGGKNLNLRARGKNCYDKPPAAQLHGWAVNHSVVEA